MKDLRIHEGLNLREAVMKTFSEFPFVNKVELSKDLFSLQMNSFVLLVNINGDPVCHITKRRLNDDSEYYCLKIYTSAPPSVMDDRDEPIIGKPRSTVFNGAKAVTITEELELSKDNEVHMKVDESGKPYIEQRVYGMNKKDFEQLPVWDQRFIKNTFNG